MRPQWHLEEGTERRGKSQVWSPLAQSLAVSELLSIGQNFTTGPPYVCEPPTTAPTDSLHWSGGTYTCLLRLPRENWNAVIYLFGVEGRRPQSVPVQGSTDTTSAQRSESVWRTTEVAVVSSPSLIVLCGRKATFNLNFQCFRVQELCEGRGGRPGLPAPNSLMVSVDVKQHWTNRLCSELRSCVKVEVAVLGSLSLIVLTVSVDGKQQWTWTCKASAPDSVWKWRWPSWATRS